jgi:hypothetical protein
VLVCNIPQTMHTVDNAFQKIACALNLPDGIDYLKNYEITIKIRYKYEIRDKTTITVRR